MVRQVFNNPMKIHLLNSPFLSLILKVEKPEVISQFRIIRLFNVMYKLVTDIIASRLKMVMNKLTGSNQCSFVLGRQSADNILVAQEVIHTMRIKKGSVGFMALKIDMEKAYDHINWKVMLDTLQEIGLPKNLVKVIWWCISSTNM